MERLAIVLLLAFAFVGSMMTDIGQPPNSTSGSPPIAVSRYDDGDQASRSSVHRLSAQAPEFASSSKGGALVLERAADGHFYADVAVNNRTLRMMVDTGASTIALTAEDARRAGIPTSLSMNLAVGEGAGGTVYGDVARLSSVRLGKVSARDLPVVVIKGGSQSLLGQSFLRQFKSVNIEGDHMVLRG